MFSNHVQKRDILTTIKQPQYQQYKVINDRISSPTMITDSHE